MIICIGDIVKLKNGAIGMVRDIQYYNKDNYLTDKDTEYFGQGMELNDIEDFSIIPNCNVKWAWYRPKELDSILVSASQYARDITMNDEEEWDEDEED